MEVEPQNHFDRLSDQILLKILSKLHGKDLLLVGGVSKRFHTLASEESLWESFAQSFPPPKRMQHSEFAQNHPHKANAMRSMRIDYNFRHSFKPIENWKTLQNGGDEILCMDESMLVTRLSYPFLSLHSCILNVLSLPSGELLYRLTGHSNFDKVVWAEFTMVDGAKMLVSISNNSTLRVCGANLGRAFRTFNIGQMPPSNLLHSRNIAVHANTVAYGSGARVAVWNLENGQLSHALNAPDNRDVCRVALDKNVIVFASYFVNTSVSVWNRQSEMLMHNVEVPGKIEYLQLHNESVVFNTYSNKSSGGLCHVLNTVTGDWSAQMDMIGCFPLVYSNRIFTLGWGPFVHVFNMDGQPVDTVDTGPVAVDLAAVFEGNGLAVLEASGGENVNLVDLNTGKFVRSIELASLGHSIRDITVRGTVLACMCENEKGGDPVLILIDFGAELP